MCYSNTDYTSALAEIANIDLGHLAIVENSLATDILLDSTDI